MTLTVLLVGRDSSNMDKIRSHLDKLSIPYQFSTEAYEEKELLLMAIVGNHRLIGLKDIIDNVSYAYLTTKMRCESELCHEHVTKDERHLGFFNSGSGLIDFLECYR